MARSGKQVHGVEPLVQRRARFLERRADAGIDVPAKELERQLGVTYKTAWRMAHEIRKLMAGLDVNSLFGEVEADETYIGGKRSGEKRGRGAPSKTVIVGMKQCQGPVKSQVVPDAKRRTIEPIIRANVRQGSAVHTDEWWAYRRLGVHGFKHEAVNHGSEEWVRGDCHTNSIEGYWSQVKRSIPGYAHPCVRQSLAQIPR